MNAAEPKTLMEAVRYFADADRTLATMVSLRWPDGVYCPTCGRTDVRFIATRRMWECKEKHPRKQFSAKVGTIFEDSPLPLDKWFVAVWSIANCKNGISSYELGRAIGVTQKSAWHMLHRIRLAMEVGGLDKTDRTTEVDETYVGPVAGNMHKAKRDAARRGTVQHYEKAVVLGMLERGDADHASQVRAATIKDANAKTLQAAVRANVNAGSMVVTDGFASYRGLERDYLHQSVDHQSEFVRGIVHTNGIENFWSLLKRGLKGTYVSVEAFHLDAYVAEQAFRFNERKANDAGRFKKVVSSVVGKRLTYRELIGHGGAAPA
jgi:transposase-like protein